MKENYTHIAFILDKSGSMGGLEDDTIGGFNTFLEDQKSAEGRATVTFAQFDNTYDLVEEFTDISDVPSLTEETYIPGGMTALHDAIGRTVDAVGVKLSNMEECDRPDKVVVCIMTDGHENSSSEYNSDSIKQLIDDQKWSYSWEFVFMGANQDAIVTSGHLGIAACNTMTYASNSKGTRKAMGAVSANLTAYRSTCDSADLSFSEEDRKEQTEEGAYS